MTEQAPSTSNNEAWRPLFVFQARGLDFFWIVLRNLLFTILTLGIYSFWAKVRQRAFIWRATRILDEPLEYTGTGKELFLSFLIVMGFFIILTIVLMLLAFLWPQGAPVVHPVLYLGLIYAIHFASYRTLRYRLTRTRWRGIRGNLDGGAAEYALSALGYTLALLATFGILGPWCVSGIVSLQLNNTFFGNRRCSFDGPTRELYVAYYTVLLATLVLVGAGVFIVYSSTNIPEITQANPHPDALLKLGYTVIAVYAVLFIAIMLLRTIYQAAFARWFFGHLSFGAMRLRSTLTAGALVKLSLGNMLLLACTLGIAYPWVRLRTLRVPLNCIDYAGDPDLEGLLQDTMPAPKRGEGLLEALDIDIAM